MSTTFFFLLAHDIILFFEILTFSQLSNIKTIEEQESHLAMRKYSVDIADSIYADFKSFAQALNQVIGNFVFKNKVIQYYQKKIQFRAKDKKWWKNIQQKLLNIPKKF